MAVQLRYTGGGYGGAINGVPARDLTDEDIAALNLDADDLVKGGLYVLANPPAEPAAKAERVAYDDKAAIRSRPPHTAGAGRRSTKAEDGE